MFQETKFNSSRYPLDFTGRTEPITGRRRLVPRIENLTLCHIQNGPADWLRFVAAAIRVNQEIRLLIANHGLSLGPFPLSYSVLILVLFIFVFGFLCYILALLSTSQRTILPGLKPTSFTNPTRRSFTSFSRTASTDLFLDRFF